MNRFSNSRRSVGAIGLLLGGALVGPAPAADASIVDWVETVTVQQPAGADATIRVASNGTTYTDVTDGRIALRVKGYGRCKKPSRVARSSLYVDRLSTGGSWDLYHYHNTGLVDRYRTYEWTETKTVDLNAAERQSAINACKTLMTTLMNQGKPRHEVLSEDRVSYSANLFEARHYFGCDGELLNVDLETATKPMLTPVLCKAFDFPPGAGELPHPTGLVQQFGVTAAQISVSPQQSTVVTKANLTVSGAITANGPGEAKIRVSHNGKAGPLTTIRFDRAGVEEFSFPLTIPCPSGAGGSGGSGGGIGGLAASPPTSSVNGHLEFQVVTPTSGVRKSNKTFYSVTCRPTPTVAPRLPDLVVELVGVTGQPQTAEVRNIGSAPAAATQLEIRCPGGAEHVPVPALGIGKEASIPVSCRLSRTRAARAVGPAEVVVDQPPKVAELDESNNSSKK